MLAVLGCALAPPAHAQFGIPQIVIDPAAIAKIVASGQTMWQQYQLAKDMAQRFDPRSWRSWADLVNNSDQYANAAGRLGLAAAELNQQFEEAFPESRGWFPKTMDNRATAALRESAFASLTGSQQRWKDLQLASRSLTHLEAKARGAESPIQLAQIQAELQARADARQLELQREQMEANRLAAVRNAFEADDRQGRDVALAQLQVQQRVLGARMRESAQQWRAANDTTRYRPQGGRRHFDVQPLRP